MASFTGRFNRTIIDRVQQANNIVDIIGEHVRLVKRGREMVGLCPFHEDHRPSLYVNEAKQIYKCFACGAGGGVFTFVQMRENLSFPQAVERLAERAGIELPRTRQKNDQSQSDDTNPNELAKVNQWASGFFHKNLKHPEKGKQARQYLHERKISAESIDRWKLGLAPANGNELVRAAAKYKIPPSLLHKAGLVTGHASGNGLKDKFVSRLMFTITDVTGRVLGFGGRTLSDDAAKYINSPTTVLFDKSRCLYGLEEARHAMVSSNLAIVVEGYTDCIMAHQFGFRNVVATLGTSFTEGHARLLRRYVGQVVMVFDSDTAGIAAANRALETCLAQRLDIKLAVLSEGKDPCDFLLSQGKEGFERIIANAVHVFDYKWNKLEESLGREDTFADRKTAISEFLDTVVIGLRSGNLAAIDKGLMINRLAKTLGMDSIQLNEEVNKRLKRRPGSISYGASQPGQEIEEKEIDWGSGCYAAAQREILEVLLVEPALFEIVRGKIQLEDFGVPILRQAAQVILQNLQAGQSTVSSILAKAESPMLGRCIVEMSEAGEKKANFRARLAGALDAVERHRATKNNVKIETPEDQKEYLKKVLKYATKGNRHNVGLS